MFYQRKRFVLVLNNVQIVYLDKRRTHHKNPLSDQPSQSRERSIDVDGPPSGLISRHFQRPSLTISMPDREATIPIPDMAETGLEECLHKVYFLNCAEYLRRNCHRLVEPTSSNGDTAFVAPLVVLQI